MSIERHLEQHSRDPERLHATAIETSERRKARIDFYRILTPEVMRKLKEEFGIKAHFLDENTDVEFDEDYSGGVRVQAELKADIQFLHRPFGAFSLSREESNIYKTDLDVCRMREDWLDFLALASHLTRIDPAENWGVTPEDVDQIQKVLAVNRGDLNASTAYFAARLKILDPSKAISFTRDEFRKIEQDILALRNKYSEMLEFAGGLQNLRVIADPLYHPPVTERMLEQMEQDLLEYVRMNDWIAFTELAVSLKLVTAYEVRVTGPGIIEIIADPPDLKRSAPPRPERKAA